MNDDYKRVESFNKRLRKALDLRDMKQTELSKKIGIAESTVSNYLNGKYEPRSDTLEQISNILKVRPEWLIGLDVPMEEKEFQKAKQDARVKSYILKFLELSEENRGFIYKQIDLLGKDK